MLSIICPTRNELENISNLLEIIDKEVKCKYEIIFVDDDSTDGNGISPKEFAKKNVI